MGTGAPASLGSGLAFGILAPGEEVDGQERRTGTAMSGHAIKRWLYLTHRWIGIVSCLFFAMWFASGLVMLYVPYPSLEREDWLAGQSSIDWPRVHIGPAAIPAPSGPFGLQSLTLEMRGREPVWRSRGWTAKQQTRSAVDGRIMAGVDETEARAIARDFAHAPIAGIERIERDQWTVAGGYDAHRPLWKTAIAGPGGRELYVSSQTGQVVLQTTARQRFWNWVGSVPHWIYPTVLRQDGPAWRQVIIWLSGPCIIAAITGIWIGILRIRLGKRRFSGRRVSPYRGWMKWHHITGLAGCAFLLLWIFSGWLSVDPGRIFSSEGSGLEVQTGYAGSLSRTVDLARLAAIAPQAKSVTLAAAAGNPYLKIESQGQVRYLSVADFRPPALGQARILERLAVAFPGVTIASVHMLRRPDSYWSAVHEKVPLPVLRVELDDRARTWIHVDPATGEVYGSLDRRGRIYRWLYTAFHRWDLTFLLEHRPARDILIWVFSLLGLLSSITGVWIGWQRLQHRSRVSHQW